MLRLLDCFDDILIEPFMPNGSIIAFDISILLRLARLDMLDRSARGDYPAKLSSRVSMDAALRPTISRTIAPLEFEGLYSYKLYFE